MKVIIAGTRTFKSYRFLKDKLQSLNLQITEVVCGEAMGADTLGRKFAEKNGIPVKSFPADWNKYGKQAGPIRNDEMAKYGDILVAFWNKKSRGTGHMIRAMRRQKKPVYIFSYTEEENKLEEF